MMTTEAKLKRIIDEWQELLRLSEQLRSHALELHPEVVKVMGIGTGAQVMHSASLVSMIGTEATREVGALRLVLSMLEERSRAGNTPPEPSSN